MPVLGPTFRRRMAWILAAVMAVSVIVGVSPTVPTQAAPLCTASLDGAQQVPPVVTPATGTGTIDFVGFDQATGYEIVDINLTFSGLTSPQNASHIHAPAPPGQNANVIIPLNNDTPTTNFRTTLLPTQRDALEHGQAYFNVHTVNFPNGEIRGQISCQEFPQPSTPTPTVNQTATPTGTTSPTLTPTATVTPTPGACSPRPRVLVQPVTNASGQLRVTIQASNNTGFPNRLQSITWGTMANASVRVNGIGLVSTGQTTQLAGSQSVEFLLTRVNAGQAATVVLTVADDCGTWPTFVGGGPTAFRPR